METENKNQLTLYRFVSLRSPELSKKENQNKRFVFHPDNNTGDFFEAIQNKPSNQSKWDAMQSRATTYVALQNEIEIENLNPEFYIVSEWIARNRSNFDSLELLKKIISLSTFDLNTELNLWDNLFYQIVTQKSFYVKEALMQTLILQNLLKQIKNLTEEETLSFLPLLANAKVVLPDFLFSNDLNTNNFVNAKNDLQINEEITLNKEFLDAQLIQSSKNNINNLENFIEELKTLENNYYKEYQKKYNEEIKIYQDTIYPILEEYQKKYDVEKRKLCANPRDEHYDPNDICNLPDIDKPEVPKFNFNYPNEFDNTQILTQLSKENQETLNKLIGEKQISTFQEIVNLASEEIKRQNIKVSQKTITTEKTITIGDTVISANPTTSSNLELPFQICSSLLGNGNVSMYMSIQLPNNTYEINQLYYTLQHSTGTNNTHGGYIKTMNGNVMTLNNMFANDISFATNSLVNGITGYIKFTNGQEFTFAINSFSLIGCYKGKLISKSNSNSNNQDQTRSSSFIPKGFGYRQLGIADYKKVVAEVCCYDAGEVAHIENVMASELRSKVTTKTYKSEVTDFESTEIEKENMTDVASTERFEMQTEVTKLLAEQREFSAYADVHTSWGNTTLDAGGTFASNTSKEESNRQAVTQAKELTQRAVEKIVSRVKKEKTIKITNEFVEENTHAFDNRGNENHISGVYRFINAIYKNQIFNYGKRLMYEFMVPQPSKLHHWALKVINNNENVVVLEKPIDPATLGITDFTAISPLNYQNLASKYNASVDTFPAINIVVGKSFDYASQTANSANTKKDSIIIKDNRYKAKTTNVIITGAAPGGNTGWGKSILITVGNQTFYYFPDFSLIGPAGNLPIPNYIEEVPVAIWSTNFLTVNITVNINCELTEDAKIQWQKDTYEKIIKGYLEQLRIYNEKLKDAKTEGSQILGSNPLFYRQIEQMVLRKNCISYFLDNSPTSPRRFGRKMYTGSNITDHQVTANQSMDDYGSFAKFMEQAFEWNLMSYNFYPYYWGNSDDWSELYQYETNDPIFRSFMQAGMARVIVTVKPGFEEAVMHYLTTGQIWNGGQTPIIGDPLFLSIVDELKEQEYTVEETWKTVVPTHLIGLQRSGVSVAEDGLPCSCPAVDALNKTLVMNDKILIAKP